MNHGESGYEHGCWIIETDARVKRFVPEFVPLASRPFVTLDFDLDRNVIVESPFAPLIDSSALFGVDVPAEVKDGAFVKVRVTATEEKARKFSADELRAMLVDVGAHRVWVEMTVERAHRERGAAIDSAGSRVDQLAAYLEAIGTNGDVAPAMLERAAGYLT